MTLTELFVRSNEELKKVVNQIRPEQWSLEMPPGTSMRQTTLREAVNYHTYDDAWVPDVLAGKSATEVGDVYEPLRKTAVEQVIEKYNEYNDRATDTVRNFDDFVKTTHVSYGDFSARDYLQHIISFRGFRCYDIAKLIGIGTEMPDALVQGLWDEFSPVIEGYRQMGVFPAAIEVPEDAGLQEKLLGLVGRS